MSVLWNGDISMNKKKELNETNNKRRGFDKWERNASRKEKERICEKEREKVKVMSVLKPMKRKEVGGAERGVIVWKWQWQK